MIKKAIIEEVTVIVGEGLDVLKRAFVWMDRGHFEYVGEKNPHPQECVRYRGRGLLMIPGLINAHTHIGDSFAKDLWIGRSLNELFRPITGLKHKLLNSVPKGSMIKFMRNSISDMIRCGTTTFADFREGGRKGAMLLRKAMAGMKIRAIVLGRPDYYFGEEEVIKNDGMPEEKIAEAEEVLGVCDGIGLSGPNEYTDRAMRELSELVKRRGKMCAIHAGEDSHSVDFSLRNFDRSEVERALENLEPDFIVHMTQATDEDLGLASKAGTPVVCCPRANSVMGSGLPPMAKMARDGMTVALGTDNVMLNSTDLFREMEYTSRMIRALERDSSAVSSKDIMKMVTINSARALKLDKEIGSIEEGKRADVVFIDMNTKNLDPIKDPLNAIVHRARPDDIRAVIIGGEIVYGSIPRLA
ncbi:MAG: amidohydrolase family protein [Nitrososphaerales archaeon]|nr:amidohydrolase family protein [Nitrososphaerales archaeon]